MRWFAVVLTAALLFVATELMAAGEIYRLAPGDSVQIRVIVWNDEGARFEALDAVNGEYPVEADGSVSVPLAGQIDAEGLSTAALGQMISDRLQERLRSAEPPDTAVAVAAYRPIYVVGDVQQAGSYPFVPDLSVVQALTLAGGLQRVTEESKTRQLLTDIGNLEGLSREVARARTRELRLLAEVEGRTELSFPEGLVHPDGEAATALMWSEEEDVFTARRAALERELNALDNLKTLLDTEINALESKLSGLERQLELVRETLSGLENLVDRGLATNVRLANAQRNAIDLEARELDLELALFRAQQRVSETERDATAIRARFRTDATEELQRIRSQLELLTNRIKITKALLLDTGLASATILTTTTTRFTIRRQEEDGEVEMAVAASALLQPGDVLQVAVEMDNAAVPSQ